jgi:hypothetical protein
MAGNFHSDALRTERYTPDAPHPLRSHDGGSEGLYAPLKINLLLYRRLEQNLQILIMCASTSFSNTFRASNVIIGLRYSEGRFR